MNSIAVWELRSNLSGYLEQVKVTKKPVVFWNRHKKEFLILPFPTGKEDEAIFDIYDSLEDKMIQAEYYKWIESNMSDWKDDQHEGLFE